MGDGDAPRAAMADAKHDGCPHRDACDRAMRRFVGSSDHVTPDPARWLGCRECEVRDGG